MIEDLKSIFLPIAISAFIFIFSACGGIPGSDKTSSSSSNTTTTINTCNEDGTVNDQSSTVTNPAETASIDTVTPVTVDDYTPTSTTTTTTNNGLQPVVPGNGIGVVKQTLTTEQANECAENHLCKILKAEGNTATIEHCSNVTIIVGSDYQVSK